MIKRNGKAKLSFKGGSSTNKYIEYKNDIYMLLKASDKKINKIKETDLIKFKAKKGTYKCMGSFFNDEHRIKMIFEEMINRKTTDFKKMKTQLVVLKLDGSFEFVPSKEEKLLVKIEKKEKAKYEKEIKKQEQHIAHVNKSEEQRLKKVKDAPLDKLNDATIKAIEDARHKKFDHDKEMTSKSIEYHSFKIDEPESSFSSKKTKEEKAKLKQEKKKKKENTKNKEEENSNEE